MNKFELAKQAIDRVFNDTTLSIDAVIEQLEELCDYAQERQSALKEDLGDE